MKDGAGDGASGDPWATAEALQTAMSALQGLLLAVAPPQREALRRHWLSRGGTAQDVTHARNLLIRIVHAMQTGDRRTWNDLARAHATLRPRPLATGTSPETVMTPDARDFTLPAVTEFWAAVDLEEEPSPPSHPTSVAEGPPSSIDETIALGRAFVDDDAIRRATRARPRDTGTLHSNDRRDVDPLVELEKYAVLCAWTEAHPERRAQLHAQYGLADEAARTRLDAMFEGRFQGDPHLRKAFESRRRLHAKFIPRRDA